MGYEEWLERDGTGLTDQLSKVYISGCMEDGEKNAGGRRVMNKKSKIV